MLELNSNNYTSQCPFFLVNHIINDSSFIITLFIIDHTSYDKSIKINHTFQRRWQLGWRPLYKDIYKFYKTKLTRYNNINLQTYSEFNTINHTPQNNHLYYKWYVPLYLYLKSLIRFKRGGKKIMSLKGLFDWII